VEARRLALAGTDAVEAGAVDLAIVAELLRKNAMQTDAKGDKRRPANGSPAWTKISSTSGGAARNTSTAPATTTARRANAPAGERHHEAAGEPERHHGGALLAQFLNIDSWCRRRR